MTADLTGVKADVRIIVLTRDQTLMIVILQDITISTMVIENIVRINYQMSFMVNFDVF